jgi:hypothetical protein
MQQAPLQRAHVQLPQSFEGIFWHPELHIPGALGLFGVPVVQQEHGNG